MEKNDSMDRIYYHGTMDNEFVQNALKWIMVAASSIQKYYDKGFPKKITFRGPIGNKLHAEFNKRKIDLKMTMEYQHSQLDEIYLELGRKVTFIEDIGQDRPSMNGVTTEGFITPSVSVFGSGNTGFGKFVKETRVNPNHTIKIIKA